MNIQSDYNTARSPLIIGEYGRHLQDYIEHIAAIPEKSKRNESIQALLHIMTVLNPNIREQSDYKEKLWGHVMRMANYNLDVDCPFPIVKVDKETNKPEHLGYTNSKIKFRFYGRNLQNMVDHVAGMEMDQKRTDLVNYIATFMYNSCKSWNNENLSNSTIAEHLKILSKGKIDLSGGEIQMNSELLQVNTKPTDANISQNFIQKKKKKKKKKKKNNTGNNP